MRALLFRGIPKRGNDFYFYKKTFPFPGTHTTGTLRLAPCLSTRTRDALISAVLQ